MRTILLRQKNLLRHVLPLSKRSFVQLECRLFQVDKPLCLSHRWLSSSSSSINDKKNNKRKNTNVSGEDELRKATKSEIISDTTTSSTVDYAYSQLTLSSSTSLKNGGNLNSIPEPAERIVVDDDDICDDVSSTSLLNRSVYVHPLSQIILEYLQDCHHDWIVYHGLDRSLTLHRDGSFELKFPTTDNNDGILNDNANETVLDSQTKEDAVQNQVESKIWTSYDDEGKKHWLTVQSKHSRQRFLLQDNLLPAWHGNNKSSVPERIHSSVDAMIRAIDRIDIQQHHDRQQ